ncbi:MAG TPA: cyclic nucleotide-binding domain-containing protein [bacterium]|nr:cyclic nucleotide-binding domain-containing protein [bacterium]
MALEPTSAIFKHLRRVLQQTYFLQSMSSRELDQLTISLKPMRVFKGYEIIKQGDPGDAFYLVASGRVSVFVNKGEARMKVAELGADKFFGEMALISNEPRTATVMAEGLTELFVLEKSAFQAILMKNPAIAEKIKDSYKQRGEANSNLPKPGGEGKAG